MSAFDGAAPESFGPRRTSSPVTPPHECPPPASPHCPCPRRLPRREARGGRRPRGGDARLARPCGADRRTTESAGACPGPGANSRRGTTSCSRSAIGPIRCRCRPGRLAYWPDGSIKWSGQAIATASAIDGPLHLAVGPRRRCRRTADRHPGRKDDRGRHGGRPGGPAPGGDRASSPALYVGTREVAHATARLIALREDRSRLRERAKSCGRRTLRARSRTVKVEQDGPVRAVVKITGSAQVDDLGSDLWLPFTVRLYFFRGSPAIRIVHSFIYDGEPGRRLHKGARDVVLGALSRGAPEQAHALRGRQWAGSGVSRCGCCRATGAQAGVAGGSTRAAPSSRGAGFRSSPPSPRARGRPFSPSRSGATWSATQVGPNGFSIFKRSDAGLPAGSHGHPRLLGPGARRSWRTSPGGSLLASVHFLPEAPRSDRDHQRGCSHRGT